MIARHRGYGSGPSRVNLLEPELSAVGDFEQIHNGDYERISQVNAVVNVVNHLQFSSPRKVYWQCDSTEHFFKQCNQPKKSVVSRTLYCTNPPATGYLNGVLVEKIGDPRPHIRVNIKPVFMAALLDSGAPETVVGSKGWHMIQDLALEILPYNAEVMVANGHRCKIKSKVMLPMTDMTESNVS
ncbi:hypothetical protein HHI36_008067 [Cryptolaemus montrouzieri]|uniref:Peptidase A2 domain-containing protein n=1 Tax=Cryptolaemus montrouzieri TaxID=559131 RepID=A0ABD2MRA0_9CUCU